MNKVFLCLSMFFCVFTGSGYSQEVLPEHATVKPKTDGTVDWKKRLTVGQAYLLKLDVKNGSRRDFKPGATVTADGGAAWKRDSESTRLVKYSGAIAGFASKAGGKQYKPKFHGEFKGGGGGTIGIAATRTVDDWDLTGYFGDGSELTLTSSPKYMVMNKAGQGNMLTVTASLHPPVPGATFRFEVTKGDDKVQSGGGGNRYMLMPKSPSTKKDDIELTVTAKKGGQVIDTATRLFTVRQIGIKIIKQRGGTKQNPLTIALAVEYQATDQFGDPLAGATAVETFPSGSGPLKDVLILFNNNKSAILDGQGKWLDLLAVVAPNGQLPAAPTTVTQLIKVEGLQVQTRTLEITQTSFTTTFKSEP